MNSLYKRNRWKLAGTVAVVLWIAFIWGHSLIPGDPSKNESLIILNIVNNFLGLIGIDYQLSLFLMRKIAHFTEYFIFGILLLTTLRLYVDKIREKIFNILFIGLAVPVIDEFIQLFVDGRGGEIRDVIIDFSGVLTGMLLSFLIIRLVLNIKENKIEKVNLNNLQ